MIKRIVFDGNDGTGKTTRLEEMKKMFPNIKFEDRGIFSKTTLDDMLFDGLDYEREKRIDTDHIEAIKYAGRKRDGFRKEIERCDETLFVICRCEPRVCQERIRLRGDSIEEEYHTMSDLIKYGKRFDALVDIVRDLPNVMVVDTENDIIR